MSHPEIESATLCIAMQLAQANAPQSAAELVRQHQSLLDGLPIENHAAAYYVKRWLEDLHGRDLVDIVLPPPHQRRGIRRYRWLGPSVSAAVIPATGANP